MGQIERFIVDIDSHPWIAVFPRRHRLSHAAGVSFACGRPWLGLGRPGVVPRVADRVARGPRRAAARAAVLSQSQETWAARRALSKEFDSYAWQRLFWFGPGMLLYGAVGGGLGTGELAVVLFCLIGGGAGLLVWRSARAVTSVQ